MDLKIKGERGERSGIIIARFMRLCAKIRGMEIKERLAELQAKMTEAQVDFYFINTSDYHMSEYISEHFKTLRYFSGFSGSLGQLVVSKHDAHLFVDGRYHTQAQKEIEGTDIILERLGVKGVLSAEDYLIKYAKGKVVGLDGRVVSAALVKKLLAHKIKVESIDLYSDLFFYLSPLNSDMLYELAKKYTGLTRLEKLCIIKEVLHQKTMITQNLESVAYILNLRGNDIAYTPVFLANIVFNRDNVYLFINKSRLSDQILEGLYEDGVIVRPYEAFYDFIRSLRKEVVLLDENKCSYETYRLLDRSNEIHHMLGLIEEMKMVKNPIEIKNNKLAHIYDGVAMLRFMKWLKESDKEGLTEYDVKLKVNRARLEYKAFDLSFNTIVGYNANAAMMHYSPTKEVNAPLHNAGIILIDSGGQYFEGTTDITRTFALGEVDNEIKMYFTLVLASMFNLASVKFLKGLSGDKLDILARQYLWERGIDYRCGTGHGVGQVLAVHEMPPNIRYRLCGNKSEEVALKPGNIFSDEPGVYFEGKFGIRCENLLLCKKEMESEYGEFLGFEHLTMLPFDLDLIDLKYLDEKTRERLNSYHQDVYKNLAPYLNEEEKAFLKKATRSI